MGLKKPKSITIQIFDRKEGKSRSFVVYNESVDSVENKIKNIFKKG